MKRQISNFGKQVKELKKIGFSLEEIVKKTNKSRASVSYYFLRGKRFLSVQVVMAHKLALKKALVKYSGGKCSSCGYSKCFAAMDFHHIDPNKKDMSISGAGAIRAVETLIIETNKTVLLCRNCHAEHHAGIKQYWNLKKLKEYRKKLRGNIRDWIYEYRKEEFAKKKIKIPCRRATNRLGLVGVRSGNIKGTYRASIVVNGNRINLGTFNSSEKAAKAYDKMSLKYKGPDAEVNFL